MDCNLGPSAQLRWFWGCSGRPEIFDGLWSLPLHYDWSRRRTRKPLGKMDCNSRFNSRTYVELAWWHKSACGRRGKASPCSRHAASELMLHFKRAHVVEVEPTEAICMHAAPSSWRPKPKHFSPSHPALGLVCRILQIELNIGASGCAACCFVYAMVTCKGTHACLTGPATLFNKQDVSTSLNLDQATYKSPGAWQQKESYC